MVSTTVMIIITLDFDLEQKCYDNTLRRRPSISGIFVSQLRSAFRAILLGLSRGEMDAVFGTDVALNIALLLKCC